MCPVLTRGKKSNRTCTCSELYNQWANNSSQRLPFFYYIPCAGHCLPYTLLFIGKQSDCLSSTLSFAIYQLYDLEQIYSPSCSSTFLICKMGMRLAPI